MFEMNSQLIHPIDIFLSKFFIKIHPLKVILNFKITFRLFNSLFHTICISLWYSTINKFLFNSTSSLTTLVALGIRSGVF
jgi:hypothetical protein